jgi:hypothetical protein
MEINLGAYVLSNQEKNHFKDYLSRVMTKFG